MKDILIAKVREQEVILSKIITDRENRHKKLSEDKTYQYERAKLIGMLDILDALQIDRKEFSWVF